MDEEDGTGEPVYVYIINKDAFMECFCQVWYRQAFKDEQPTDEAHTE